MSKKKKPNSDYTVISEAESLDWKDGQSEEVEDFFEIDWGDTSANLSEAPNPESKKKLSAGRIILAVITALVVSSLIFLIAGAWYKDAIRYPAQEEIIYQNIGRYAIDKFYEGVTQLTSIADNSYLNNEVKYANGNADRIAFMNRVAKTVSISYSKVVAKNIYGNDMINSKDDSVVKCLQNADPGEEVALNYIDYDAIEFDKDIISAMLEVNGLKSSDLQYQDKLTDMFCEYIYSLDSLPVKSIPHSVALIENPEYVAPSKETKGNNKYIVADSEDQYLDQLLFSSDELYNCFERFDIVVWEALGNGELKPSAEWVSWSELSDAKKEGTPEPLKYSKYGIPHIWCGAYYLKNEYRPTTGSSVGITPMVGDGSIDNPAGLNTPVLTKWLSKEEGNIEQYDIRVELVEFGVSQDALNYFQSKDTQNRGYDVTATLQYFYAVFSITNLSDDTLTITDDSALCDKNANASNRTGNIYGMTDTVTLQPGEEGYIETWGRSMELPKKYLIWGKSFERLLDPVWFRVLAGNIDDTSENKGVYVSNQK